MAVLDARHSADHGWCYEVVQLPSWHMNPENKSVSNGEPTALLAQPDKSTFP